MHELAGELTLVNSASRLSREAEASRPEPRNTSQARILLKTVAIAVEADDIDRHPVLGMRPVAMI